MPDLTSARPVARRLSPVFIGLLCTLLDTRVTSKTLLCPGPPHRVWERRRPSETNTSRHDAARGELSDDCC